MYSPERAEKIEQDRISVTEKLRELAESCQYAEYNVTEGIANQYMSFGVAARIDLLGRAVENIFAIYPISRIDRLAINELYDVRINHNSFSINLHGCFDNLAWAFVLRHNLYDSIIKDKRSVGLFNKKTHKFFTKELRNYVISLKETQWYKDYSKRSRDALAHRIPPSIYGSQLTEEEIKHQKETEKAFIESPSPETSTAFSGSFYQGIASPFAVLIDPDKTPIDFLFHGQLIEDCKKIVELGNIFLKNWDKCEHPSGT